MSELYVSILFFPWPFFGLLEIPLPTPTGNSSIMVLPMLCSSFQKSQSFFTEIYVYPGPCWKSFLQHQEKQKEKNPNKQKTPSQQQTSWRHASGQTCDIDCTGRDLLAWKGDRDAQAAKGQNCPFLYVKSPVPQFGHTTGTISFTQRSLNQSLKKNSGV